MELRRTFPKDDSNSDKSVESYFLFNDKGNAVARFQARYYGDRKKSVEISYHLLDYKYSDRGYATVGLKMVCRHIFDNNNDVRSLLLSISSDNLASKRVAEKSGFINKGNYYKLHRHAFELVKGEQLFDYSEKTSIRSFIQAQLKKKKRAVNLILNRSCNTKSVSSWGCKPSQK